MYLLANMSSLFNLCTFVIIELVCKSYAPCLDFCLFTDDAIQSDLHEQVVLTDSIFHLVGLGPNVLNHEATCCHLPYKHVCSESESCLDLTERAAFTPSTVKAVSYSHIRALEPKANLG